MNQIAIAFDPAKILPAAGTQAHMLLLAFGRGERLTVLTAIQNYGVYALSQRCGDLKRLSWPISSRTIHANGKSFSEYWMDLQ